MRFDASTGGFILFYSLLVVVILSFMLVNSVDTTIIVLSLFTAIIISYLGLIEIGNDFYFGKDYITVTNDFKIMNNLITIGYADIEFIEVRSSKEIPVIEIFLLKGDKKKFACLGLSLEDQKKIVNILESNNVNTLHVNKF